MHVHLKYGTQSVAAGDRMKTATLDGHTEVKKEELRSTGFWLTKCHNPYRLRDLRDHNP